MSLLKTAEMLLDEMMPVVPIKLVNGNKRPMIKWSKGGFVNPDQVKLFLKRHPETTHIGIIMPPELCAIDIDKKHGKDGYRVLRSRDMLGSVQRGVRVKTTHGEHRYFRRPEGGKLVTKTLLPGVDLRGDGRVIVVAGPGYDPGDMWKFLRALDKAPPFPKGMLNLVERASDREVKVDQELLGEEDEIRGLLERIPNTERNWDDWKVIGAALFNASGGEDWGLELWHKYSRKCEEAYDFNDTETAWAEFERSPYIHLGVESLRTAALRATPASEVFEDETEETDDGSDLIGEGWPTMAEWGDDEIPPPKFVVDGLVPEGVLLYLSGDGSSGKSFIGQTMAMCVAGGIPFAGHDVEKGKALYLTMEDDTFEARRRAKRIAKSIGLKRKDRENVYVVSCLGMPLVLYGPTKGSGQRSRQINSAVKYLETHLEMTGAKFVVFDNFSHLYGDSENNRIDITRFLGILNGIIERLGIAILLICHTNKKQELSGSTALRNVMRGGYSWVQKSNTFIMRSDKALSVAGKMQPKKFVWDEENDCISVDGMPFEDVNEEDEAYEDMLDDLRDMILQAVAAGQKLSAKPQSENYLPDMLANGKFTREQLKWGMERLMVDDILEEVKVKTKQRKMKLYLALKKVVNH